MHRLIFVIAIITFTTSLHAEGITSTPPQNVRFAEPSAPNDLTPPKVLLHPYAAYSDEARQLGIEGNVVVQAHFDEKGNFTALKVVQGLGHGLDENALAMLKEWRFSPALQNGLPVSAIAEIEVPFYLKNEILQRLQQRLQMIRELQGTAKSPAGYAFRRVVYICHCFVYVRCLYATELKELLLYQTQVMINARIVL